MPGRPGIEGLCGCWADGRHSRLSKGGVCGGMFPISIPSSSFQEASLPCTAAAPHFISEHLDLSKQEVAVIRDVYTHRELGKLVGTPVPVLPKNPGLQR